MQSDLLSLVFTNRFNNYKFTSTTTYANQDLKKEDYAGGLSIDFDVKIEEITQEFKLNYSGDGYDFLGGVYYSDKFKFDYNEYQYLQALNLTSTNDIENTDDSTAIYFQGRYWLKNNYALSLGARYQKINRDFSRDLTLLNTTNTKGSDTTTWNHFSPMASLSYYSDDGDVVYFTYSQGYRAGGYNYRQIGASLIPYKEETTNSYEIGYKNEQKNYNIETTLFYNDIKNHRINNFDDTLATTTHTANKATSYGG